MPLVLIAVAAVAAGVAVKKLAGGLPPSPNLWNPPQVAPGDDLVDGPAEEDQIPGDPHGHVYGTPELAHGEWAL